MTSSASVSPGPVPVPNLKIPPSMIRQHLSKLTGTLPVFIAVGLLFIPLGFCIFIIMMLAHSALIVALFETSFAWFYFLKYTCWDSLGGIQPTKNSFIAALNAFYIPLLLAIISLRSMVHWSISKHIPHTSIRKLKAILGLGLMFQAGVWLCFSDVAMRGKKIIDTPPAPFTDPTTNISESFAPILLFLSLYSITFYSSVASIISCFWTPTSDQLLREAEYNLLTKHADMIVKNNNKSSLCEQQLKQHYAAHHSYVVLKSEFDCLDVGSNRKDENEGSQSDMKNSSPAPQEKKNYEGTAVVFLHGYAAGKSLWFKNLPAISSALPSARIYALDLLGMGLSAHQHSMANCNTSQQAEAYFVEGLEGWRKQLGIEKMVLAGHSFGGYIASCYAMRYPARVSQLLLISPVGLPIPPPINSSTPLPSRAPQWAHRAQRLGVLTLLRWLWSQHILLSQILHFLGPLGKFAFIWIVKKRFAHLEDVKEFQLRMGLTGPNSSGNSNVGVKENKIDHKPVNVSLIANYLYHLNAGACPGHKGLNLLLQPGAFAIDPLLPRLKENLKIPTSFMYGAVDWMEVSAGSDISNSINSRSNPNKSSLFSEVVIIPMAGHQLFLENSQIFNEQFIRLIKEQIQRDLNKPVKDFKEDQEDEELESKSQLTKNGIGSELRKLTRKLDSNKTTATTTANAATLNNSR